MPRGDRTGPQGMGPMTRRAAGYCAGYDVPGTSAASFRMVDGVCLCRHQMAEPR